MSATVEVTIIGAPVACQEGVKDTWRGVAAWAANQLVSRFGEAVQVTYYDLFDMGCPTISPQAQLPLVLVNGEVLTSGGKISVPAIRHKIEDVIASWKTQQEPVKEYSSHTLCS